MAVILNAISSSSGDVNESNELIQNLLAKNADIPFDKNDVNSIQNSLISLINGQLNRSNTRHDGLRLLLQILPRCSRETFSKYTGLWLSKATQTLDVAQGDIGQITTASRVIAHLVVACKEIPELQKQISMQNVKQLISHVNSLSTNRRYGAIYYMIAVLLYHYPEPCERQQTTISKFILPLIDSTRDNLVRAGANCYALLTSATERSFKAKDHKSNLTAWTHSQNMICNSLHETMDAVFSGLTELEHFDAGDSLALPTISQNDVMQYYLGLELRFRNLCIYLATTLGGCGSKNSVSPSNIFKLLRRGLSVTPAGLGKDNSFKKQILQLVLPKFHTSLLHVLDSLISGFRKNLIPYSKTILKLVQQILTWTENVTENTATLDGNKSFKNTRISAYKSLSLWLNHAGASAGIESMCENFLSHVVKDVVPLKDRVLLTVQKTHNLSKRALKRHRESQYDNNPTDANATNVFDAEFNADLAEEALRVLENMFLNLGCRLERSFHETSQNMILVQLYDCYLDTRKNTFYSSNNDCRLQLLKTLKSLHLNPHHTVPPPIQYSVEIFQIAQFDADLRIVQEAKIALNEIEKLIHPAAPTLRLPILRENDSEHQETRLETVIVSNIVPGTSRPIDRDGEATIDPTSKIATNAAIDPTTRIPEEIEIDEMKRAKPNITTNATERIETNAEPNAITRSEKSPIERTNYPEDFIMNNSNANVETSKVDEETFAEHLPPEIAINFEKEIFVASANSSSRKEKVTENSSNNANENTTKQDDNLDSEDDTAMLSVFCDTVQEDL